MGRAGECVHVRGEGGNQGAKTLRSGAVKGAGGAGYPGSSKNESVDCPREKLEEEWAEVSCGIRVYLRMG